MMQASTTPWHRASSGVSACVLLAAAAAGCGLGAPAAVEDRPFEVWLVDQSDSPGLDHGGTLYIYDGLTLAAGGAAVSPVESVDLASATAALCRASTGAAPVRPHMLLFNGEQTHAVLAFVASGHVVIFDAVSREPLACMRTQASATGRQAHAAYPAPDGSYILVANQNGKLLERIDVDFDANRFQQDPAATLDLAGCVTPAGQPCERAGIRPDNAPICPVIESGGRYAFVTLRGGGLLVVDARSTPMRVVAEYDMEHVRGSGCGGVEAAGSMYINSGGRPGGSEHLELYGFDVYRFALDGFAAHRAAAPNSPLPQVVYTADGEHDSHGMVALADGAHIWVADRHANAIEVIRTADGAHLNTITLAGTLSADPAPDLIDVSPARTRVFVALRGPTPLSGDPHTATGSTPGLGVLEVRNGGRDGRLLAVIAISNPGPDGIERADAHAVRVRLK
jgi:hypothetical protein